MRLGNLATILRKPAALASTSMLAAFLCLAGCETSGLLDPGELMRTTNQNITSPINTSLAPGLDDPEPEWSDAEDVKQSDLVAATTDYVISRNDLLSISVAEVAGQGIEQVKTTRVSESGNISLALIGPIKAAGLTEAELEKAIANTYREQKFIQNANVSVTVVEARGRTFSVLGAIGRPGQYQIMQSDFRFLDALTIAGDIQIQGIEYAYVIRKTAKPEGTTKPATGETKPGDTSKPPVKPPADPLEGKPGAQAPVKHNAVARASVNQPVHLTLLEDPPAKADSKPADDEGKKIMVDGKWVPVKSSKTTAEPAGINAKPADPLNPKTDNTGSTGTTTNAGNTSATGAGADAANKPNTFHFDAPVPDPDTRVIRVPIEKLQRGERQYNIVIRANDTIVIPPPKVGEYYMGMHVQRPGVYSLTGRQITLKEAITSAGGIDPLGWPDRTEIIRRVGRDKEIFVRVNLPKIFAGQESDIFLRPYDQVNVGTNMLAPFLASIRGAFRFTYGFGFIYDRNFSPQQSLSN